MAYFGHACCGATVHWRAKFEKRIGCRGRDTNRSAPPAQNRTCAFTHTASTLDKWRQSVYLRHFVLQQPIPILGKHRRVPDWLVHAHPHEPAEQYAVID